MESRGRLLSTTKTSFRIIDALVELEGARTTEIAEHIDISKSTASNHLHTLRDTGYITNQGDIYHPTLKFAYIGEHAQRRDPAYEIITSVMADLDQQTPFENSFVVEENGIGRYLTPEVRQPERYDTYAFIGQKEYLHATAAGKAILATLPDQYVEKIIDYWGLPAKTDQTITEYDKLFEELETVREQGYGVNKGENEPGLYVIGKAVCKPNGTTIGAISIGTQQSRIREQRFTPRIVSLLNEYVDIIENKIDKTY